MSAFERTAPGTSHEAAPPPWERLPDDFWPHGKAWRARVADGQLRALLSTDGGRLHLSVSHTTRLPTWDELADARYRFCPDRARMASLLPPRAEWVNHHPRTLHLWELPELADLPEEGAGL